MSEPSPRAQPQAFGAYVTGSTRLTATIFSNFAAMSRDQITETIEELSARIRVPARSVERRLTSVTSPKRQAESPAQRPLLPS